MHSFENGTGHVRSRDNWRQLQRFFAKRGIAPGGLPLSDREVEDIMASKPESVLSFVNRMYEFLSGRRLPEVLPPPPISEYVPGFAKATAARVAQETSRVGGGSAAGGIFGGDAGRAASVRAALDEHEGNLAAERYGAGGRSTAAGGGSADMDGGIRAGGGGGGGGAGGLPASSPTVQVKEVHIRKIDEEATAARLRAQKELSASRGYMVGGAGATLGGAGGGAGVGLGGGAGGGAGGVGRSGSPVTLASSSVSDSNERGSPNPADRRNGRSPLMGGGAGGVGGDDVSAGVYQAAALASTLGPGKVLEALNNVVLDSLSASGEVDRLQGGGVLHGGQRGLPSSKAPAFAFTDMLTNPAPGTTPLPDAAAVDVLRSIQRAAPAIAIACLGSPRGFQHVVSLLLPLLGGLPDTSPALPEAADAFVAIGIAMCNPSAGTSNRPGADNQAVAGQLFRDFALPHIVSILKHRPAKRPHLLSVAYAFAGAATSTSTAGRRSFVQTLQEELSDITTYIHCLAITASLETDLSVRD
jgi:hypothetical protein